MFEIEKGSIESSLFYLQNMGLELNEYKKTNSTIPIDTYEHLLNWTIETMRSVDTYEKKMKELLDQIPSR